MKLILLSVGKSHDTLYASAITEFTKRLNKYMTAEWVFIAAPKNAASMSVADLKKAEAQAILQCLDKTDFFVLLDERGKQFTSVELATFIQQRANESCKKMVFLIGGAFGVDESVFQRANFVWCLSKLVYPHMLVRLVLAEQLYRAYSIINNEKYHHI
jgi:23S rRNA (pseudouridine1915-N3)-methyltransferase